MTEEEMRNDPKYKEITKKLDSYLIYNNVPGYLNFCMDSLKECVQQKIDGDPEREEVTRLAINDNMSYFGATDNEEHSEFFKKMIDLIAQKRVACIFDQGKEYDEYEQQIKNGEMDDMDTYALRPDETNHAAMMLLLLNSKMREKGDIVKGVEYIMLEAMSSELFSAQKTAEIREHMNSAYDKAMQEYHEIDENTKNRYRKIEKDSIEYYHHIPTSLFPEKHYLMANKTELGYNGLRQVPGYVEFFKTATDEQLDDLLTETKQNLKLISAYESSAKEWADNAKKLTEQLEKETPEDKKDEKYNELHRALENASNLGGHIECEIIDPKENQKKWKSYYGYSNDATQLTYGDVTKAADGFQNRELAEKINKAVASAKEKTDEAYKPARHIYERSRRAQFQDGNISFVQSKNIATDIKRIEMEQQKRIVMKDPEASAAINSRRAEIKKANELNDDMTMLKQSFKFLQTDIAQSAELLEKDRTSRNIPEKDKKKHKEYFDLTEKAEEFKNLSADDLTPKQLLEKLSEAKKAADTYVDTHAGVSNLFSGWTEKGRYRIAYAKRISHNIENKMKELEPLLEKLKPNFKENETIGEKQTELADKKQTLRTDISEIKQKALYNDLEKNAVTNKVRMASAYRSMTNDDIERKHPDAEKMIEQHREKKAQNIQEITEKTNRSIPENDKFSADRIIQSAQEQLISAKSALPEGSYPDKSEKLDTYASLVAAQTLKMSSVGKAFSEGLPENIGDLFNDLKATLKDKEAFSTMILANSSQTLYEHATRDKGQELWNDYFTAGKTLKNNAELQQNNTQPEWQKNIENPVKNKTPLS